MDAIQQQRDIDLAFGDLEHLLDAERQPPFERNSGCAACGGTDFVFSGAGSSHVGSSVCQDCGVVQPGPVFFEHMYGCHMSYKSSNYKRIHHWHERISQLLLLESEIPAPEMLLIAERLCDGSFSIINKDNIRTVIRSLKLHIYIEKWLQIIYRITRICPPTPGSQLIGKLDDLFIEMQRPFDCSKLEARKNFLNYNYVFCRLFQMIGCTQFCMFFPLIKSAAKLQALDETWTKMAASIDWEIKPLQHVGAFSVRLEKPELLLQRLRLKLATSTLAAPKSEPIQISCRMWGHPSAGWGKRRREHNHSSPTAPSTLKLVTESKRRLRKMGGKSR
jgi:hypothetical protein